MQITVDDVLKALGPTGQFEICQYIWLFLSLFTTVFGTFSFNFIARNVPHQCAPLSSNSLNDILASLGIPIADVVSNSTTLKECTIDVAIETITSTQNVTVECVDGRDFGPLLFTSVVSEFDLVCDRIVLSRLPQFFFLFGRLFGAMIVLILEDTSGRRPILFFSHAVALVLALSIAFPKSIEFLIILKGISGAFIEALYLATLILTVEITQVKDRTFIAFGLIVSWSIAVLVLLALSFGLRFESWRILEYALTGASIVIFFQIFTIQESIRWLFAVNRDKDAIAVIRTAAEINNVDIQKVLGCHPDLETAASSTTSSYTTNPKPEVITDTVTSSDTATSTSATATAIGATSSAGLGRKKERFIAFRQIHSNRFLLKSSFIFIYVWFVASFCYFALYFTTGVISDDVFLNFTINAVADLPAAFIFFFGVDRIGRKNVLYTFLTVAVVFLSTSSVVTAFAGPSARKVLLPLFGFLGKTGVAGTFFGLIMYTAEVYPTPVRSTGVGIAILAGKAGPLGAPFLIFSVKTLPWFPSALVAVLLAIALLAIIPLPETRGHGLPKTMADVDKMHRD